MTSQAFDRDTDKSNMFVQPRGLARYPDQQQQY